MKTIIKIIYIAFGLIMAVIIALAMYTSFASTNYSDLLKNAVAKTATYENYAEGDYNDIVRCFSIFSTPLEDHPDVLYAEDSKNNITFIYESVNQHVANYTVDGKKTEINRVEDVYLVVILRPKFYYNDLSDKTNPSAFRFYGTDSQGNEQTYDYKFTLSDSINNADYIAAPATEKEAVLNGSRSLLSTYKDNYDLIFFPLTETTVGFIKETKGIETFTGFNIVDNEGSTVYKNVPYVDFAFDYQGEFYTDMADFVYYYNIHTSAEKGLNEYDADTINVAEAYLQKFTENPASMVTDFNTKYIQGYERERVYTGFDMVAKTIGITVLFVVVLALIYVLLFHLKGIKKFIARFSKKEAPVRKAPNIRPATNVVISKSKVKKDVVASKPKAEETKEALEPKEEVKPVIEAEVSNVEDAKEETPTEVETKEENVAEVETEETKALEVKEETEE